MKSGYKLAAALPILALLGDGIACAIRDTPVAGALHPRFNTRPTSLRATVRRQPGSSPILTKATRTWLPQEPTCSLR